MRVRKSSQNNMKKLSQTGAFVTSVSQSKKRQMIPQKQPI
jgi:hypothetical protein